MIDITEAQAHLKYCIDNKQDQIICTPNLSAIDLAKQSVETIHHLNDEIEKHRHELVIYNEKEIVRLDDVYDGEDDYYWIYNKWVGLKGMYEEELGEIHATCVGSHILLKGFIPDEKYTNMVRIWNLNNFVKAI